MFEFKPFITRDVRTRAAGWWSGMPTPSSPSVDPVNLDAFPSKSPRTLRGTPPFVVRASEVPGGAYGTLKVL